MSYVSGISAHAFAHYKTREEVLYIQTKRRRRILTSRSEPLRVGVPVRSMYQQLLKGDTTHLLLELMKACTEFPYFEPTPQAQTILHCLLRHLLQEFPLEVEQQVLRAIQNQLELLRMVLY